ncbi:MAG: hypothetical protein K2K88_09565 [Muribaculaceae bacterium]|nr:hypothetical protein [Muribaculaceae bacterium]
MMKKTILALSLSVLSVLGFSAIAQNQNVENKKCENKECCKKEGKKDCKDRKDFGKAQYNPFEGLNLTEAQTQKLAALKSEKKSDRVEGQRPEKKEQLTAEQRQQKMQERDNRSREYLAKVKAILTPEQYVSFLENVAVHKSHHKMMARHDGNRHDMKKDGKRHDMQNMPRGNRGGNGRPVQPSSK